MDSTNPEAFDMIISQSKAAQKKKLQAILAK